MIIVKFNQCVKTAQVFGVWQYNYGQVLRIQGLALPPAVEVHFSLQSTGGEATTRIGVTKDGVTDVVIPDSFLENGDATQDYEIYAFIYPRDGMSGWTEYKITMHVTSRPKPEAFDRPEDAEIFKEAIKAVNESAARSAESEKQAEGWAHGREGLPERAQDNAKYYSDQAREDSTKTDADRKEVERLTESNTQMQGEVAKGLEEVKKLSSQAQTSATNAALSEQKSEEAATRAERSRTGAETAEGNAELAAQKVEQDKAIVEQAKNLVKQMGQEVLDNKNLVDKTAQDFDLKAQQALADVNNAGQEIIADREKISKNVTDIADLRQGKADAIVETVSGTLLNIRDSAKLPIQNLRIFGKSEQVQTTGANLFDEKTVIVGFVNSNNDLQVGDQEVRKERTSDYILLPESETNITATALGEPLGNTPGSYLWAGLSFYDAGKNFIKRDSDNASVGKKKQVFICNIPQEAKYVRLSYRKYNDVVVMLNTGSIEKPYEPYTGGKPSPSPEYPQEIVTAGGSGTIDLEITGENVEPQSITLQTPNGLPGIKVDKDGNYTDKNGQQWITDEIDLARGKYVQRVDKIEVNGTTIKFVALEKYWNLPHRSVKGIVSTKILSNISTRFSADLTYEFIFCRENTLAEYFTTVDELNDYCLRKYNEGNPVVFYYAISSIERDLTPEEIQAYKALHTNYQSTVITNNENAGMEVFYIADTKNYIDKKFKELNQAIVNTQIALL